MVSFKSLKIPGICLAVVTIVLSLLLGGVFLPQAFAEPLTPEAAQYEIDRAHTPAEAGQRLQAQARAHKEEIKTGPKPVQGLAKTVTENTQTVFQLASERVQETLGLDESNASKDSSSN